MTEYRQKTEQELKELLNSTKKDIGELVKNVVKGKEKNVKKARLLRKELARINTVLNEKIFLAQMEENV